MGSGKRRLYQRMLHSPLRRVVGPLYDGTIAAELAAVRALDALAPAPAPRAAGLDELTAIIKTFERPRILCRLVASIRRFYPTLKLIVVDDSRAPTHLDGVETLVMPYNSGLSQGRRAALERITTPYLFLMDDDFVFYRHTRVTEALARLAAHPMIDIMGGAVVNLPLFDVADYATIRLFPTDRAPTMPPGGTIGGLAVLDKVPNFFLARTERIRLVNWDPALRLVEHADFFTRARGVLTTVHNPELRCLHARALFDRSYQRHRQDVQAELRYLRELYAGPPARRAARNSHDETDS